MAIDRQQRRQGIGGSDVAAILGYSPWNTPLDIWRSKVLQEPTAEGDQLGRGHRLEPAILRAYALQHDAVLEPAPGAIVADDGWRMGNVDAMAVRAGWRRVVEAKSSSPVFDVETKRWEEPYGADGSNEVPVYASLQGQWYMDLTDTEECDYPVLMLPRDWRRIRDLLGLPPADVVSKIGIRTLTITYNPALAEFARNAADEFWHEHVLPQIPPPPRDLDDSQRCWWSVIGKPVEVGESFLALVRQDKDIAEAIKHLEQQRERVQFAIREVFGECDRALFGRYEIATLKTINRKDGAKYRTLRTTQDWTKLLKQIALQEQQQPQAMET